MLQYLTVGQERILGDYARMKTELAAVQAKLEVAQGVQAQIQSELTEALNIISDVKRFYANGDSASLGKMLGLKP